MADFRGRPASQNVERRSKLDGLLEALLAPQGPIMDSGANAANPENLPAVPRLAPGGLPMTRQGPMDVGLEEQMAQANAGSPPMMPPGPMMERLSAPRLGGGGGGDIRGMAANDMLNATPAARADAGGGQAPRAVGPAPTGFTMADVDAARQYIASRTIHYRMGDTSPEARDAAFNLNPVAAVRSANLIAAAEEATGASAVVTEAWRSDATQAVYKANQRGRPVAYNGVTYRPDTYLSDDGKTTITRKTNYPTASPGKSNHREGGALDLSAQGEAGKVRSWMMRNSAAYGMQPIKGDDPHLQVNESIPLSEDEASYVVRELGYADVQDFQQKNGLDVDGVVGPQTTKAMLGAISAPSVEAAANPQAKPFTVYSSDVFKAEKEGKLTAVPPMSVADAFNYVPPEAPGGAQDALVAAAEAPVDYDSTVLPPDVAPMSFAPRLGGQQGSQTGDRTMSQTNAAARLNNVVGDRTMDQPPLRPDGTPYEQPPGTVPAGDRPPPAPRLRPAQIAAPMDRVLQPGPTIPLSAEEQDAVVDQAGAGSAENFQRTPVRPGRAGNDMTMASIDASARGAQERIPRANPQWAEVDQATATDEAGNLVSQEADVPTPRLRPATPPVATPNRRTIASGESGEEVRTLQKAIAAGMPGLPSDFIDGKYGPYTEGVVMAIQERAARENPEIIVDGIVGDQTWPLIDAFATSVPTPSTRASGTGGTDVLGGTDRTGDAVRGAAGGTDVLAGYRANTAVPRLTMADAIREADYARGRNGSPNIMQPPAIGGAVDSIPAVAPRLMSGRTGPPITITSSAPTIAGLPRGMNSAAYPTTAFDDFHSTFFNGQTGLSQAGQWAGIASPPVVQGRSPSRLSLDAMPQTDSISDRMGDAFKPVAPASTTAPPPAPRLAPAGTPVATTPGAPGAPPPAGGGVAGVYTGGGPTGSPAVAVGGGGTGPGYGGMASSGSGPGPGATASTGSSGGATPPSYYDSSRGSVQTWNSTTQSYQSTGYGA